MHRDYIESVVKQINAKANELFHLEVDIHSYRNNNLTLIAGEDLLYYHNFQLVFEDVFSISMNSSFHVNTSIPLISVLDNQEGYTINRHFRVEVGNYVFVIQNSDNLKFHIVARNIKLIM